MLFLTLRPRHGTLDGKSTLRSVQRKTPLADVGVSKRGYPDGVTSCQEKGFQRTQCVYRWHRPNLEQFGRSMVALLGHCVTVGRTVPEVLVYYEMHLWANHKRRARHVERVIE